MCSRSGGGVARMAIGAAPGCCLPTWSRPGVTAPNCIGALLMAIAALSWGVYSILGRVGDPLEVTANNFIYLVPRVIVLSICFAANRHLSSKGLAYAAASGSAASGLGYVVWYEAQKRLSAISAATVQLSVAVVAALGGLVLITENVTLRLLLASGATQGGIAVVLTQRQRAAEATRVGGA